jgi:hypothetical protein
MNGESIDAVTSFLLTPRCLSGPTRSDGAGERHPVRARHSAEQLALKKAALEQLGSREAAAGKGEPESKSGGGN